MTDTKRDSNDAPIGVGPGITGASGDFISSTGGNEGVGGTGHETDEDVSGARPDERQAISRQDLLRDSDERPGDAGDRTRLSAGVTGNIGGGGPHSVRRNETSGPGEPGGGGSGALGDDLPGGIRHVEVDEESNE